MTPEEEAVIQAAKVWHDLRLGIRPDLKPGSSYTAESFVNVTLHQAVDDLQASRSKE